MHKYICKQDKRSLCKCCQTFILSETVAKCEEYKNPLFGDMQKEVRYVDELSSVLLAHDDDILHQTINWCMFACAIVFMNYHSKAPSECSSFPPGFPLC